MSYTKILQALQTWYVACADPESFVRGGPTLTSFVFFCFCFFFVDGMEGGSKLPLKVGHHRPASETPLKWRFAGVPILVPH